MNSFRNKPLKKTQTHPLVTLIVKNIHQRNFRNNHI